MSVQRRTAELLLLALVVGCSDGLAGPEGEGTPKSVILLIGDGTGPQQWGLLMDWADAAGTGPTNFEKLANEATTGFLRTASASSPVTDSAAAATALASGVSTGNGMVGVDPSGKSVGTCLEDARAHGKHTGLVTTTTITDATPACFAAHVASRGEQGDIARQYIESGAVDVLFGGGAKHFVKVLGAAAKGWKLVLTSEALAALPPDTDRALGLFAKDNVPFAIDRDQEGEQKAPTLPEMAKKALEILSRDDKGFFLMVEGGRIDHACHGNDAAAALGELREFDQVVGIAAAYRHEHKDTLVIVTSDHETGGLCVTYGVQHPQSARNFLDMAKTERSIEATEVPQAKDFDPARAFGGAHADFYPASVWFSCDAALARSAKWDVSFGSQGHSTTPVFIVAAGPGANAFSGCHRNTLVGTKLREWMGR